jgi:hypothetical protein
VTHDRTAIRTAAAGLFIAWLVHDVEEVVIFPATSRLLAERLGAPKLRVTPVQSAAAISLVGALVAVACARGVRSDGGSRLFRAVLAGLEAHVGSHLAASALLRRYTAGVVTAPLVMLPAARRARATLRRGGAPLRPSDTVRGAALMFGAAFAAHAAARIAFPSR